MTKHTELIARLEALTGPDREADALIWCHFAGVKYIGHNPSYFEPTKTQVEFNIPPKRTRCVTSNDKGSSYRHAEPVTASIDAAVALCERVADAEWSIVVANVGGKPSARIWVGDDSDGVTVFGSTPAIALLIATLKALNAKEQSDD